MCIQLMSLIKNSELVKYHRSFDVKHKQNVLMYKIIFIKSFQVSLAAIMDSRDLRVSVERKAFLYKCIKSEQAN